MSMAHAAGDCTRAIARSRVEISEHPQNVTAGGGITSRAFEHFNLVAVWWGLNCAHRVFYLWARRCSPFGRANAWPQVETSVGSQGVEAGAWTIPPAFCCCQHGKGAHISADCLVGCSAESIIGRAAGIHITPLFARFSWELWGRRR
jgi:hypothetical protein